MASPGWSSLKPIRKASMDKAQIQTGEVFGSAFSARRQKDEGEILINSKVEHQGTVRLCLPTCTSGLSN
jgi:hypothetical protein